jgi:hypothetical protein
MLTVKEAFERLKTNLALTNAHEAEISRRKDSVVAAIGGRFEVKRAFVAGSFRRGTAIQPMSRVDVDVFIVLPEGPRTSSPNQLLDKTRSALAAKYSETLKISRNGQAVTIRFPDFGVDVIPCFERSSGGVLIPDSANARWISTDPEKHAAYLLEQHRKHNNGVIPLVRMLKGWNLTINHAFTGFYLELLAIHAMSGATITDQPSAIVQLFKHGCELAACSIRDPAGLGEKVTGFSALTTVPERQAAFQTAFDRATRALAFERNGAVRNAFESWRSIFGQYFPNYG